eukprot:scaffold5254_cov165-Amphora_coffeaeformis.AAC.2
MPHGKLAFVSQHTHGGVVKVKRTDRDFMDGSPYWLTTEESESYLPVNIRTIPYAAREIQTDI